MSSPTLTAEDVLAWNETTTRHWYDLLAVRPEILELPCDIYPACETAANLLQHIAAVELRYAQRLAGESEIAYEQVPSRPASAILLIHQQAHVLFRREFANARDWSEKLTFQTVSRGQLSADRKTILFHALFHGIRHYAQLATIVRQHGIQPGWPMDYMFMGITVPESK